VQGLHNPDGANLVIGWNQLQRHWMGASMTSSITELSDKVVVITTDRYLPIEHVKSIVDEFKKKGFELIWLQL
jgi:predicted CoA-binding protein